MRGGKGGGRGCERKGKEEGQIFCIRKGEPMGPIY